jgi:nucleoside-diphosphate-sugar epimerase
VTDSLVIGGTGPSGSSIVERLLARGDRVTIFHTGAHEIPFTGEVEHIHADPRELEELEAHLSHRRFDVAVSTSGRIRHVVEALRGRVGRLVAISGLPVFRGWLAGPGEPGIPVPIREDDPKESDPAHKHGYRVHQGEQTVMAAHEAGDFDATIVRYTMVYGPHTYIPFEWFLVRRILDGRRVLALEGDGVMVPQRGYAENLAEAVILAAASPIAAGRSYNVGDEQALSLRTLIDVVAGALGYEWDLVPVPLRLSPCRNPFALRQNTLLDLSRIRSELGYRDVVPVVEATEKTVRWMRDHPIRRGGPEEAALGPFAFDYDAEDRVTKRCRQLYHELERV